MNTELQQKEEKVHIDIYINYIYLYIYYNYLNLKKLIHVKGDGSSVF